MTLRKEEKIVAKYRGYLITEDKEWPLIEVSVGDEKVNRPDILIK